MSFKGSFDRLLNYNKIFHNITTIKTHLKSCCKIRYFNWNNHINVCKSVKGLCSSLLWAAAHTYWYQINKRSTWGPHIYTSIKSFIINRWLLLCTRPASMELRLIKRQHTHAKLSVSCVDEMLCEPEAADRQAVLPEEKSDYLMCPCSSAASLLQQPV